MLEQGLRLQLLIGPSIPVPAPFAVVDALTQVVVRNHDDARDGFQLTFTLGRDSMADSSLLTNNYFEPPNRVIVTVILGVLPQILIDGIITNHQVAPSNRPGDSTLVVTGEDISLRLDLQDKNETYRNQSDSEVVETILRNYRTYGLNPRVTPTTRRQAEGVTTQQATDLEFIQDLAGRNAFVFYVEPTTIPGQVTAYWGSDRQTGSPQPELRMNMGPSTNLESLSFAFDALAPTTPSVAILDPNSRQQVPVRERPDPRLPLARQRATALRTTVLRDVAQLDQSEASLVASTLASDNADAVTGTGTVDVVRYGQILRARKLVNLLGAGRGFDGQYYVKQVTHTIKRGEYKQDFSLKREGRGRLG